MDVVSRGYLLSKTVIIKQLSIVLDVMVEENSFKYVHISNFSFIWDKNLEYHTS